MKKNTPPKNTKKDFEKVYENPLEWCPLYGYVPDQINIKLKKQPVTIDHWGHGDTLSAYDLAQDYIDWIKESRQYWNVGQKQYNLFQHERLPKISNDLEKNKVEAARCLFKIFLVKIAYFDPKTLDDIYKQWTPFISTRTWKHYESGVSERPASGLLYGAQPELDFAGDTLGFNYKLSADEIYAMFALHETWIMLIRLLKNEFTCNDENTIFDAGDYITTCLENADTQRKLRIYSHNSNKYEAQRERGKKNLKPRQSLEGVKLVVDKLKSELKNNSAESLYGYLLRHYSVDDDLVKALLDSDAYYSEKEIEEYFYKTRIGEKTFYIGMIPDKRTPDYPASATLIQIEENDKEATTKKLTFGGFKEYCYPRKKKITITSEDKEANKK